MDAELALLDRWRAGDKTAGNQLFERHYDDVYRFLVHKVGSDDAAEIAQTTFLNCVRGREQFRARSTFRTYVFTIARNELYDFLRARRRDEVLDFGVTSIGEVVTSLASRIDRDGRAERLRAALRELPADQQLLLELHYWHEHDAAALAEIFDATPGAIRVRLLRARRALADRMSGVDVDAAGDRLAAALADPTPDV